MTWHGHRVSWKATRSRSLPKASGGRIPAGFAWRNLSSGWHIGVAGMLGIRAARVAAYHDARGRRGNRKSGRDAARALRAIVGGLVSGRHSQMPNGFG